MAVNLLFQSILVAETGQHFVSSVEFLLYGTHGKKGNMSGAYLFLPDGNAVVRIHSYASFTPVY